MSLKIFGRILGGLGIILTLVLGGLNGTMDIGVLRHVGYPFMALGLMLAVMDNQKTSKAKTLSSIGRE